VEVEVEGFKEGPVGANVEAIDELAVRCSTSSMPLPSSPTPKSMPPSTTPSPSNPISASSLPEMGWGWGRAESEREK
jgi:hypothetical protein